MKLKDKQLKVTDPETKEEKGSVPIEDIGLLMLDHYQITLSHQLIQAVMSGTSPWQGECRGTYQACQAIVTSLWESSHTDYY